MSERSKLSFVKTAVLTSNDGGNTFEDVKMKEVIDDEGRKLSDSEVAALKNSGENVISNLTLFEQLQKNQDEKDKLWQERHGPQAPKALDEEDVLFLKEEAQKEENKRIERNREEENELAKFHAERQKLASSRSNVICTKKLAQRDEPLKDFAPSRQQKKKRAAVLGIKRKRIRVVENGEKNLKNAEGTITVKTSSTTTGSKDQDPPKSESNQQLTTRTEEKGALDFLAMYGDDSDSD